MKDFFFENSSVKKIKIVLKKECSCECLNILLYKQNNASSEVSDDIVIFSNETTRLQSTER